MKKNEKDLENFATFWHLLMNPILKFNNFLRVSWFLGKIILLLYTPFKISTTHIIIVAVFAFNDYLID